MVRALESYKGTGVEAGRSRADERSGEATVGKGKRGQGWVNTALGTTVSGPARIGDPSGPLPRAGGALAPLDPPYDTVIRVICGSLRFLACIRTAHLSNSSG